VDKKQLSERDICSKFILPAVKRAGWDEMAQVRENVYFTKGRIIVRWRLVTRGKGKLADFILYYKPNIPIAVIEAKDNNHSVGDGMQQALDYAVTLNIPFVFSSNGDGFVFHDRTGTCPVKESTLALDAFPSPAELWDRYRRWKGLEPEQEKVVLQDYFDDGSGKAPRYYQCNAINAAIEAIAKGQNRVLLVMATGTGKTYSATQIGLTATPKETEYVSNIDYFGKPVYFYSLKQGIQDGFLAPYKVVKVHIDRDVEGYRPEKGKLDRDGNEVPDRIYNQKDYDHTLVIDDRTKVVAKKISDYLKESGDRFQKTIVFCVDTEHAARMRQALVNENADLCQENERYVMRITGNDAEGCAELGNFIDPESKYPVIVTTSRLLSTGVDAQTCRLIVLDRPVGSMTEFKQIVGRGTRVHEDTKKYYFTIIDFRGATGHFADPDFDGEPVQIYEPPDGGPIVPPDGPPEGGGEGPNPPEPGDDETVIVDYPEPPDITIPPDGEKRYKIYVDGVSANIIAERVEYLDEYGKLVTESLRDFTKKALKKRFASLDDFLQLWNEAERKQAIVEELAAEGLPLGPLAEEVGKNLDPFDLICHVAFDRPPLTRRERAENVRKRDVFSKYGPQARAVLDALLLKYQDDGVLDLDDPRILQVSPFDAMGTPVQLIKQFGTRSDFEEAVHELQDALYQEVV